MATTYRSQTRADIRRWAVQGLVGGILAGVLFALFQMIGAALMMGPGAFFLPLRMIGAIVLGPGALAPSSDLLVAGLTGVVVHMVLSAVFGAAFGLAVSYVPALRASTGVLLAAASGYGLLLWLVNFYVIAPVAGWVWFPNETNAVVQFLAHTFFFGTALGAYLNAAAAPRRPTVPGS